MPRAVSLLLVSLVVVLGTTTQAGGVTASSSCGLHICTKSDACAVDSDCPGSSCNCGALRCEFSSCGNDGVRIINNHMLKCICESACHSVIYHYYDNYIVLNVVHNLLSSAMRAVSHSTLQIAGIVAMFSGVS